jgi:hypothetical protein
MTKYVEIASAIAPAFSAVAAIAAAIAAWCNFLISKAIRTERVREMNKNKPVVSVLDAEDRKFTLLIKNDGPGPAKDIRIALAPAFEPKGQKTAELCHYFETTPAKQPVELGGPLAPEETQLFAGYRNDVPPKRIQLSVVWTDGNGDRKGRNAIIDSGFTDGKK